MTREEVIAALNYFSPDVDKRIAWDKVDLVALQALDRARSYADMPFIISSNYRTPELSVAVGGIPNDAHTEIPCTAFDIQCKDSHSAFRIIGALFEAGFNRIGYKNKSHVHADRSELLPNEVFWIE